MPTLNIEGKRVKVGEEFLGLSPEEQARTVDEIAAQIGVGASSTQSFAKTMRKQKPSTNIEDTTQPSAIGQWAKGVDDRVRSVARGLPLVGPYMDEIAAGMNVATGRADNYDTAVKAERARDKAHDETAPVESLIGKSAGMIGGAIAAAPLVAGNIPATMLGKMRTGAGLGAGIGAVEGFGRGEGGDDRVRQMYEGAGTGAVLGAAAPIGAAGVGKLAKWGVTGWRRFGSWLMGQPAGERKALTSLLRRMEAAGITPEDAATRLNDLGQQGMLADVNQGMQVQTGRIAASDPGAARIVGERLLQRREGGGQRVAQALDDAFGPARDPHAVETTRRAASQALAPEYQTAYTAKFDPRDVVREIDSRLATTRGPIRNKLQETRKLLLDTVKGKPKFIGNGEQAHQARMALDDMIEGVRMDSSIGRHGQRALSEVRHALDRQMKTQIPEFAAADAKYATTARAQEAFNYGREELFRGGPNTPSPMAASARLRSMSIPERQAARQGARYELERQTSNVRRNPALTAEAVLSRDFNDEKARLLTGRQPAKQLGQRLEAENTFLRTSNLAEPGRGSRTAMIFPEQQPMSRDLSDLAISTTAGAVVGGPLGAPAGFMAGLVQRLGRRGLDRIAQKAQSAIQRAEADLLTTTGKRRGEIIRELGKVAAELRRVGEVEASAQVMGFVMAAGAANRAPLPEAARSYLPR